MVRTILRALCTHTSEEKLTTLYSEPDRKVLIKVDGRDQGRVVGKQGRTITSIGILAWYAGLLSPEAKPIGIKLLQATENVDVQAFGMFQARDDWDRSLIGGLIESILSTCLGISKGAWIEEKTGLAAATITITLDDSMRKKCESPSFTDAMSVILHAAGMANGVVLKSEYIWE